MLFSYHTTHDGTFPKQPQEAPPDHTGLNPVCAWREPFFLA